MTAIRSASTLHHVANPSAVAGAGSGRIRTIGYRHAHAVGELLAAAFHDESVTRWLAPDVDTLSGTAEDADDGVVQGVDGVRVLPRI